MGQIEFNLVDSSLCHVYLNIVALSGTWVLKKIILLNGLLLQYLYLVHKVTVIQQFNVWCVAYKLYLMKQVTAELEFALYFKKFLPFKIFKDDVNM